MKVSQTLLVILLAGNFLPGQAGNTINVKVGVLLMTEVDWPWDLRRVGPAIEVAKIAAKEQYDVEFEYKYHDYLGQCPLEKSVGRYNLYDLKNVFISITTLTLLH